VGKRQKVKVWAGAKYAASRPPHCRAHEAVAAIWLLVQVCLLRLGEFDFTEDFNVNLTG